ncbi:MAG: helix-turn-helix domain-containing protein [Thermodesulfobacteriota bacterium]|jgi:excisionase family DNA binding protein
MGKFEGPTFDVKQVAKYLDVSEITIYRLTAKGEIPAKKVGAQWRFVKAEVDRWLISRV